MVSPVLQRPAHPAPLTLNIKLSIPSCQLPRPQLPAAHRGVHDDAVVPCEELRPAAHCDPALAVVLQGSVQGHHQHRVQYRVIHQHRVSSHLSLAGDAGQQAGLAGVGQVELHRGGGVATPGNQDACNNSKYYIIQASSYIGVPFPECTISGNIDANMGTEEMVSSVLANI